MAAVATAATACGLLGAEFGAGDSTNLLVVAAIGLVAGPLVEKLAIKPRGQAAWDNHVDWSLAVLIGVTVTAVLLDERWPKGIGGLAVALGLAAGALLLFSGWRSTSPELQPRSAAAIVRRFARAATVASLVGCFALGASFKSELDASTRENPEELRTRLDCTQLRLANITARQRRPVPSRCPPETPPVRRVREALHDARRAARADEKNERARSGRRSNGGQPAGP